MINRVERLDIYDLLLATLGLVTSYGYHKEEVKSELLHIKSNYMKRSALSNNDQLVSAYDNVIEAIESLISAERNLPTGDATYESAMQIVLSSLIKLRCNANSGHPSSVDFAYAPEWANYCVIESCGTEYWCQHEPTFDNGKWIPSKNDEKGVKCTGRKFQGFQSYDNTLVSRFIK